VEVEVEVAVQSIDALNHFVREMRTHDWLVPQDPGPSRPVEFLDVGAFAPYAIIRNYFDSLFVTGERG
jgi:hypothetical protein